MTEPTTPDEVAAKPRDFTLPMEPHRFTIDDDTFAAPAILAPIRLAKVAELHKTLKIDTSDTEGLQRTLGAIADIFAVFLSKSSAARFRERLFSEGDIEADPPDPTPIDLSRQALPALYWLLEQYGLRPTVPSSPLLNGSETGDSTAGALATEPTGEVSDPSPSS